MHSSFVARQRLSRMGDTEEALRLIAAAASSVKCVSLHSIFPSHFLRSHRHPGAFDKVYKARDAPTTSPQPVCHALSSRPPHTPLGRVHVLLRLAGLRHWPLREPLHFPGARSKPPPSQGTSLTAPRSPHHRPSARPSSCWTTSAPSSRYISTSSARECPRLRPPPAKPPPR